jgi:uncharacterized protein (DUF885 family)
VSSYDEFTQAFHRHLTDDPNARVALGIDRDLDDLPDPSLARGETRVREARALIRAADEIDPAGLDFDQALDVDLARLKLEEEILHETFEFNGRTTRQQLPTAGDTIGYGIFSMLVNDPRPAGDRLRDVTARLEKAPGFVEAMLERLDTPVARWVGMDADQVRGLPEMFATVREWAERESWPDLPRLRSASEKAEAALEAYADRLEALPTTGRLHVGDAIAREIVAKRGIEKSLEELHAVARDFLGANSESVEELRARLAPKHDLSPSATVEDVQRHFSRQYRVQLADGDLNEVLTRYEKERERILTFVSSQRLFPIPEQQDMKILRTPPYLESSIPAGAMESPPPFREGTRTSLVFLTLSEELLDEHTELSIPGMMIHEGIPGHHLQLASAGLHPSTIRRHIDCMDCAEGWTTMLEDYMLDVGYMGDLTDEARFVGKRDIARIGARVAIDLFFMTGERKYLDVGVDCDLSPEDPFQAAGNLLRKVTGFVPGRVEAELNWYSRDRGYPLSYLTGNHLVWELKRDVIAAQKGRLEGLDLDREFHRVYLSSGCIPVSYLRRVYREEGLLG